MIDTKYYLSLIDNRRYNGDWVKNKMHGKGKIFWPDGKSYEGEYFEDKKHGQVIH